MDQEGLIRRVKGSGTYINKEAALSRELDVGSTAQKIGLILQGQVPTQFQVCWKG